MPLPRRLVEPVLGSVVGLLLVERLVEWLLGQHFVPLPTKQLLALSA